MNDASPNFPESAELSRTLGAAVPVRGVSILFLMAASWGIAFLGRTTFELPLAFLVMAALVSHLAYRWWLDQGRELRFLAWLMVGGDLVLLGLLVQLSGGMESPFFWVYIPVVYLAWRLLGVGWAIAAVTAGVASLWGVALGEYEGFLPHRPLYLTGIYYRHLPSLVVTLFAQSGALALASAFIIILGRRMAPIMAGTFSLQALAAMVEAVESREATTRGHSRRVTEIAQRIARQMGLNRDEVETIREAALVHDLGNVFFPEELLRKSGSLSPVEQTTVATHPVLACRLLEQFPSLRPLLPLVRHHHEWYRGEGYPDGLVGEAIPRGARILAVANALEAMTSERPYRRRFSLNQALAELEAARGTQFDPQVVSALVTALERDLAWKESLSREAPLDQERWVPPPASRDLTWALGVITPLQHRASVIIARLSQEFRSLLDLPTLAHRVLDLLGEEKGYQHSALYLVTRESDDLVVEAARGILTPRLGDRVGTRVGLVGWVMRHQVGRLVRDLAAMPTLGDGEPGQGCRLLVPLLSEGMVVGIIEIYRQEMGGLTEDDSRLLEMVAPALAAALEAARVHQEAKTAAINDALTGIYNHRYFYERLAQELGRAQRYRQPLTIAIIDVNELKLVNDRYGHLAGDQALRQTAQVLRSHLRDSDLVARYGGDEFGLILPEATKEQADVIIGRLMGLLDSQVVSLGRIRFPMPGRSYGLASFPEDGDHPLKLFEVADRLLYHRKAQRLHFTPDVAGLD